MWRVKEQHITYENVYGEKLESLGEDQVFDMVFESRLEALVFICNKLHMSPYDEDVFINWGEETIVEFYISRKKGERFFLIYKE